MDIKREPPSKRKKYIGWALGVVAIIVVSGFISRLKPAAPTVDRAVQWIDSVRKGEMKREVHAPGTLVPEHIRIIAAVTAGRVEALPIRPGVTVTPSTPIVELSNSDVQLQALQSEEQLTASQSALASLKTTLQQQRLAQEGVIATTKTLYEQAMRDIKVQEGLDAKGLAMKGDLASARDKTAELSTRLDIEQRKLAEMVASEKEQISLGEDQVKSLRAIVQEEKNRVASMHVVAGETGVLQTLPLELGQWVNPGLELARVAQPGRLKAVLRVPETQAKDIAIGQRASIDTRNGLVEGHVTRSDPTSQNGTVTVEVALDGPLPPNTRADLSVDGTIEIERLENVMYVARPAYGQAESTVGLFKLDPDGKEATRVNVKLGRASVNTIEVISGLNVGDKVIVSDMSTWDNVPRVRLK